MGTPDFRKMREQCELLRAQKVSAFPPGSIVHVDSERFHGIGLVMIDSGCPMEQLAVLVESLNVWWYPIEDCQQYKGKMPSWLRGHLRHRGLKRIRPTATASALAE